MVKFSGKIGYGSSIKTAPGVTEDVIIEKHYYGDVLRLSRDMIAGENVNDDLKLNVEIRVIANAYMGENYLDIRYIIYSGKKWKVSQVTPEGPALKFRLGGVYNGPGPTPPVGNPVAP
jgi:hypothetical protein